MVGRLKAIWRLTDFHLCCMHEQKKKGIFETVSVTIMWFGSCVCCDISLNSELFKILCFSVVILLVALAPRYRMCLFAFSNIEMKLFAHVFGEQASVVMIFCFCGLHIEPELLWQLRKNVNKPSLCSSSCILYCI